MSQCLIGRSIDHVVLERGDTANSWRTECWDSLRLLTPNWLARLPGWSFEGDDPDGYMSAAQVATYVGAARTGCVSYIRTATTKPESAVSAATA
jgi:putative flavoprotein involved in K+ transport